MAAAVSAPERVNGAYRTQDRRQPQDLPVARRVPQRGGCGARRSAVQQFLPQACGIGRAQAVQSECRPALAIGRASTDHDAGKAQHAMQGVRRHVDGPDAVQRGGHRRRRNSPCRSWIWVAVMRKRVVNHRRVAVAGDDAPSRSGSTREPCPLPCARQQQPDSAGRARTTSMTGWMISMRGSRRRHSSVANRRDRARHATGPSRRVARGRCALRVQLVDDPFRVGRSRPWILSGPAADAVVTVTFASRNNCWSGPRWMSTVWMRDTGAMRRSWLTQPAWVYTAFGVVSQRCTR